MSFDFGSLENKKKTSSSTQGTKSPSAKNTPKKEAPKVDFSNLGGISSKADSKPSASPAARKTASPSSSKTGSKKTTSSRASSRTKGKKSSLIKGVDNTVLMYAGIGGGILVLLIVVVASFLGGQSEKQPEVSVAAQKRTYLEQANEFANKQEYENAISAYKKAYELDPHDSYATDQISIIYRNNLHDESSAEFWKSKSEQITANKVDSNRGASAKAYAEKAERKKQKQGGGR